MSKELVVSQTIMGTSWFFFTLAFIIKDEAGRNKTVDETLANKLKVRASVD